MSISERERLKGAKGREGQGRAGSHIDTHGTWNEIEFGVLIQSNGAENFSVTTEEMGNVHNNEDKHRNMHLP